MERELGISESKKKSEKTYDHILQIVNAQIDKIWQKSNMSAAGSVSNQLEPEAILEQHKSEDPSSKKSKLSAKDSDLLK